MALRAASRPDEMTRSSLPAPEAPGPLGTRRRAGIFAIGLGIVLVLWGVFHILGPVGDLQRSSSVRVGYDAVKAVVHGAFLGAVWRAGLGVLSLLYGLRLIDTESHTAPPPPG
jgi:hypothetical protein